MKVTAVDDVINAVVTAMKAAVTYQVFDGPVNHRPGRTDTRFLLIGSEDLPSASPDEQPQQLSSADMTQEITGLGQVSRAEDLTIRCVAVGRAVGGSITTARSYAMAVIGDVGTHLPKSPTPETYAAFISEVSSVRSMNTSGGSVVAVQFGINVKARLT